MTSLVRAFWIICNRVLFKLKGISFGKRLKVCNKLYLSVDKDCTVLIGDGFVFSSGRNYNPLARNIKGSISIEKGASLTIGRNVGISSCCLWIYDYLSIGNNTKIGADTIILDSDAHSIDYLLRRSPADRVNARKSGITIGSDVLIGTRCIILKGVSIGDRTIIGSGSVVTKNIPADCIAAGNPCKVVKYLNFNKMNNNEGSICSDMSQ
ncbi:MAG: acyltransferase [Bacteroidales bacterium]|nr:acyltransferase [Bacteroidales bacterium]